MSMVWIDSQSLTDIADAIRSKNGESGTYLPSEMAGKISVLPIGGQKTTYYIKTNSIGGNDASLRIYVIKDNIIQSNTTYTYSASTIYHKWFTIGKIKIGYGMNNDYRWYLGCNSGTVKNMENNTNYTSGQTISNWGYQEWKQATILEVS